MKKLINDCYCCPRPCAECGRKQMEVSICDDCCNEYAAYVVDGEDLCEDCLIERVKKDLDQWKSDVEKQPDLYLWDAAYFLYDHIEEV